MIWTMDAGLVPILVLATGALLLAVGLLAAGTILGPKRNTPVKEMPYESGMDPLHDTRRRFDVRFHLVAIAFLVFDVELLFLYPWAVANKHPEGLLRIAENAAGGFNTGIVFAEIMFFIALLTLGFVYAWRKGVFQWR